MYAAEGNDTQTYLLLYRHANLILDHLQNHPQKNDPENRTALSAATATVGADIQKMEEIRPRIKKRYEEFQARRKAQQKAMQALQGKSMRLVPQELDGQPQEPHRRSYEKQTLDAIGNQSLAAKLAQREVQRRDAARRNVRQAGVSEEEESERRTGGVWGDWETDLQHQSAESEGDISAQIQEVARMQSNGHNTFNIPVSSHPEDRDVTLTFAAFTITEHAFLPLPFSTASRPTTTITVPVTTSYPRSTTEGTSSTFVQCLCLSTCPTPEATSRPHSQTAFRATNASTSYTRKIQRHCTSVATYT